METVLADPRKAPREALLIDRFRSGDETAFTEIVDRHKKVVYRMARRLLDSHEDADEAAQAAFIRAWNARSSFRGDSALGTWLVRITLNVAKSMRSRRGRPEESLETVIGLSDSAAGPAERMRRQELQGRVRGAVNRLPPRQREVVMLKAFSEWTYKRVAEALDLSEGAVKAHFHQAVSNLRRLMREAKIEEVSR